MTTQDVLVIVVVAILMALVGGSWIENDVGQFQSVEPTDPAAVTACYGEWGAVAKPHWAELSVVERANIAFQSILDCEK